MADQDQQVNRQSSDHQPRRRSTVAPRIQKATNSNRRGSLRGGSVGQSGGRRGSITRSTRRTSNNASHSVRPVNAQNDSNQSQSASTPSVLPQPTQSAQFNEPVDPAVENGLESSLPISRFCSDYSTEPIPGVVASEWKHFGILKSERFQVPFAFRDRRVCKECLSTHTYLTSCTKLQTKSVTNAKHHLHIQHGIVYDNGSRKISAADFQYSLVIKCCLDYSSFNSIQNVGFVKMIQLIRPDLHVPTGNHLVQNILPKVFKLFKDHLKTYLKNNLTFGSVTAGIWVDNFFDKSYICFNLFFLNRNLELVHVLLDASEIKPPHDRFNIRSKLSAVLADYDVNRTKLKFITDNGANFVAALGEDRSSCMAHNVDLLTMKDCIVARRETAPPGDGN